LHTAVAQRALRNLSVDVTRVGLLRRLWTGSILFELCELSFQVLDPALWLCSDAGMRPAPAS
jgi:hypothetical protein